MVDDNKDVTDLLSKFLNAKGFQNDVTNDPREGLERIRKEQYDIVLLDIFMPGFSGFDIIEALEKERILKDQQIVVFSANPVNDLQKNDLLKKQGIHGYVKKPIQLAELLTVITC